MPRRSKFFIFTLLLLSLFSGLQVAHAVTYTTIANGDWTSASTWTGGVIPDGTLTAGDVVTINHRVNYPENLGNLLIDNGTLTVNKILILNNVNLTMGNTAGKVNVTNGLIILTNKNFDNTLGIVTFTNGAVQLCNGNYTVGNNPLAQTNGTNGYVFSKNGNIVRSNSGVFNSAIKWCNDAGVGTGLTAENCGVARPPVGDCQNESHYLSLNTTLKKWDTSINLYKIFAGKMDYKVIGGSELKETGSSNNCKKADNSTATLTLPTGAKVKAAYLYWYTMEKNDVDSPAFIAAADSIPATFLASPLTINAVRSTSSAVEFPSGSGKYIRYGGRFADVTTSLATNPNGSYTVDVKGGTSETACPLQQENARAWSLVVVYENPALTAANRIYIYDGMVGFVNSNITVPVTGYRIPALRPAGGMTTVAIQGDPGISGEFLDTSDTTFPNYPADFANSSTGAALDIDILSGNYIAGSNTMNLKAGSNGDVILLSNIIVAAPSEMDFSDGLASYGDAVHGIPITTPTLYLGSTPPDDDVNSQSTAAADWDDRNGVDDEGGITLPSGDWRINQTETLPIVVNGTGYLNVWIDWNQDGDFDDADEQITIAQSVSTGTINLSVAVPATATGGNHTVRVRLCSSATECSTPSGFANDGEAEDYVIPVASCTGLTGDVSEVPPAVPLQITPGSKEFVASRTPSPTEGHLKVFTFQTSGLLSTTAEWDAATLMNATKRTNALYSTNAAGAGILFNSLDDAAFAATTPPVATIKSYTLDPSFSTPTYLAGRRNGSFLGPIGRGNSLALITQAINQSRFLEDTSYRTFYDNTVSSRSEKVLATSDDGFLYAFNQSDGELSWGWMPRSLVQELKNVATFQSKLFMRGKLEIIDAKDSSSNYATYVAGSYKNGLGHYVLKLSSSAGLGSVVWDEDRSTGFVTSPNRGEMGFFSDGVGNTYAAYVLTTGSNLSTLVIHNLLTTATTEIPLNFNATSTPFIMPDFGNAKAPAKKTLYLGDSNGNIRRAALLASDRTLNTIAILQTALQSTTFPGVSGAPIPIGDLGAAEPILFLGASVSTDGKFFLRAQSESRITVLHYDAVVPYDGLSNWIKDWTSYVGGAGKWDSTGTTFTPDTSGPPADLDNDGTLDVTANGIQSLPAGTKITDAAQIVANSIILPVTTAPATGLCYGNAYLNLYQLPTGNFPDGIFTTGGIPLRLRNYFLGLGEATRVTVSDAPGTNKMKIVGGSDQRQDGTTRPDEGLETVDKVSTGVRGWKELGRD